MVSLGLRGQVRSFLLKVILIISSKSTNYIDCLRHPSTTIICCLYKSFSSASTSLNTGNNNGRSEKEAGTEPFRDAEVSGTRGKIGTNSVCGITGTGESERRNALGWKLSVNAWEDINLGTDLYSLSINKCVSESIVRRRFLTDRSSVPNTEVV